MLPLINLFIRLKYPHTFAEHVQTRIKIATVAEF